MASLVRPEFEPHVVPDVTHLLRADSDPVPSINTYKAQIKEPVDPRVVDLVTDWLRRQAGTSDQAHDVPTDVRRAAELQSA